MVPELSEKPQRGEIPLLGVCDRLVSPRWGFVPEFAVPQGFASLALGYRISPRWGFHAGTPDGKQDVGRRTTCSLRHVAPAGLNLIVTSSLFSRRMRKTVLS
jgi:hypothetical protein